MKEIELSQGKVALVDDEDYDELIKYKWFYKHQSRGRRKYNYAICNIQVNGKWTCGIMHRMIMKVFGKKIQIDHIDHDGLNNQKSNLRICTNGQNQMNREIASSTGFKGVYLTRNGKYVAMISYDNNKYRIGTFDTAEEAAYKYDEVAKIHHGKFAKLNFPQQPYFDRSFVEWLIHNTMEATTYSPMLYLRKGVTVFYQKEYHLDDLYEYWLFNVKNKEK